MHNPIAQISKACSEAERDRRSRQTTKNINDTSLNTIMSAADLDVLQATLHNIDEDLDYDDRVARYQSQGEAINAIDTRRPQTPSPGVKGTDALDERVCFRTLAGDSCDPKKCIFSHDPVKMRKYLIETLASHDAKHGG